MLDAGLLPADVDGLLVAPTMAGAPLTQPAMVAEYLGLTPTYCDLVDLGGATAAGMVWRAGAAIAAGACRHVLCVLAETIGPWAPDRTFWRALPRNEAEAIYGQAGATSAYALAADRHAAEFGTTDEQRAAVLVAQRANAAGNELALYRDPIAVAERPGGADDLVAAAAVRDRPCRQRRRRLRRQRRRHRRRPAPPGVHGCTASASGSPTTGSGRWLTSPTPRSPTPPAGRSRWPASVPADVDVAELYDCYTITVILTLEDAGFCAKGEGGAFVEPADFGPASPLPDQHQRRPAVHGTSRASPAVRPTCVQAVRQLRHDAGAVQVPDCEVAFVNGNGGLFSEQCSLVLGRTRP